MVLTTMLDFDVETRGLQWYYPEQGPFMGQFCQHGSKAELLRHPQDRAGIQSWLKRNDDYRAWNSKFDLHMLEASGYQLPPEHRWHDGMVMAHIVDERRSIALQAVGNTIFGAEDAGAATEKAVKDWIATETRRRRKYSKETGTEFVPPNYSDVPDRLMEPYAAHDPELTRRVCDVLEPALEAADGLPEVYELEREVMPALYHTEKRGMLLDSDRLLNLELQAEQQLHDAHAVVEKLAGHSGDDFFNPRSNPQLVEAFERRGVDLSFARQTKTGISLDHESLAAITDDLARAVENFRSAETLYTRYTYPLLHDTEREGKHFSPFLAPDGRLHADLRQVGARTGRMSSSPNVQNWPRDDLRMRDLVCADEGKVLVACDLDQIELRVLAAFLGEGKIMQMMKDPNADIHGHTAKILSLLPRDRGLGVVESPRQRGKKFNYERIYGGGIRAIRRWHGVTSRIAKQMLLRWHEEFPEVEEFENAIEFALYDREYVKTPWGRRHRPYNPKFADRESYKFVNYMIQGAAADLFKVSVVRVHKAGIPMIALTHDEILAEVDYADADEASTIIRDALIDHPIITKHIPLDADSKVVSRWSHAKDSDFTPEYA